MLTYLPWIGCVCEPEANVGPSSLLLKIHTLTSQGLEK